MCRPPVLLHITPICNSIATSFWTVLYRDGESCFPGAEGITPGHGTDRKYCQSRRCDSRKAELGKRTMQDQETDRTCCSDTVTINSGRGKGQRAYVPGQVLL